MPARERSFRRPIDPMAEFGDKAFKTRFSMSKESARQLLSLIEGKIVPPQRWGRKAVSPIMKLLITLCFLAEGCFQRSAADNHGHSQATVSRIVAEVTKAIASLSNEFIVWPTGSEAKPCGRRHVRYGVEALATGKSDATCYWVHRWYTNGNQHGLLL